MKIVLGVLVLLLSPCLAQAGSPVADPSVDNPKVLEALKQGMQRLEREEYRAAASEFKRAAKLADGPCGPCLLGLARAYNGKGDGKKAAEAARSAIPLIDRPDALAQAYNELGAALAEEKSLAQAEEAFRKSLELGPPSPGTVRANLAGVLLRSGRHAEALDLARESLSAGPPSTNARIVVCEAKRELGTPYTEPALPPPTERCVPDQRLRLTSGATAPAVGTTPPRKIFGQMPKPAPMPSGSVSTESMLDAVIDEDGCVRDIRICKGGEEGFDRAVREAISRWVFEPATVDGKPISVYYTITTTRTAVGSN
ncbi:MAG TPA: TonB family protein [Thermoanaerobaculia bacterium]|nr:TonB family protein [Thermoanaerobaculia bacterium]